MLFRNFLNEILPLLNKEKELLNYLRREDIKEIHSDDENDIWFVERPLINIKTKEPETVVDEVVEENIKPGKIIIYILLCNEIIMFVNLIIVQLFYFVAPAPNLMSWPPRNPDIESKNIHFYKNILL